MMLLKKWFARRRVCKFFVSFAFYFVTRFLFGIFLWYCLLCYLLLLCFITFCCSIVVCLRQLYHLEITTIWLLYPVSTTNEINSHKSICHLQSPPSLSTPCNSCSRMWSPIRNFYKHIINPKYSAMNDVFAPMFACDLFTFLIVVFGYNNFGPSEVLWLC